MSLVVAGLVGTSACADRSESPVVRSDSVGVQIIETRTPRWNAETQWYVPREPVLSIGEEDGEPQYLFSNIEGAVLMPGGHIAVADRGSLQVRFFTASGEFVRAVGGPGEGPGEFGYIRGLGKCGADSLFVFELDYENVVFSSSGTYVRAARPYDASTPTRRPYSLRCAGNGHYVAVGWEPRVSSGAAGQGPVIGFYRAEAPVWLLAPSHAATDGIASIADAGLVLSTELGMFLSSERIGTANGSRPHPFGRSLRMAIHRERVYLGTGEQPQIIQYGLNGKLERLLRWPAEDLSINEEEMAAYRSAQLEGVEESRRPALERSLRDMPLPPAFPVFSRLETDPSGNLWVQLFRRPTQVDQDWLVFNVDGELLGRIRLPDDLTVTDIGDDSILGVTRDSLGVERIVLYELRKTAN